MPQFEVPFFSQYVDLGHHEWRARGCGITSVKMVMDFWHARDSTNNTEQIDALLHAGLSQGAYIEKIGWSHGGLARLAQSFGYTAFNADWAANGPTPKSPLQAWNLLVGELENGPVLGSVFNGLDPDRGGGHIVVITGFQNGLVLFNDPEHLSEREGRRVLALESFLRGFKQRYIVVRPSK